MMDHPTALRHAFRFFPYPEIVAQRCPQDWLLEWGEEEVFRHQILTLKRIATDAESDDTARSVCQSWLKKCELATHADAYTYTYAASAAN